MGRELKLVIGWLSLLAVLFCAGGLLWSMMWDSAAIGAMSEEIVTREYLTAEARAAIEAERGSLSNYITGGRSGNSLGWFAALVVASLVGPIATIALGIISPSETPPPSADHPR